MTRLELETIIEQAILNTLGTDPDTGAVLLPSPGYLGFRVLNVIESKIEHSEHLNDIVSRIDAVLNQPLSPEQLKAINIILEDV